MSQIRRLTLNTLIAYLRMFFGAIASLAITRVSLDILSESYSKGQAQAAFGALSLLLALTTATAFLEGGGVNALVRLLALRLEKGGESLLRAFSSGWLVGVGGGLVRGLILCGLAPWLPRVFALNASMENAASMAMLILGLGQFLSAIFRPWSSVLVAQERFALEYSRILAIQLLRLALCFVADQVPGGAFVGLALALVVPEFFSLLVLAVWMALRDKRWRVRLKFCNVEDMRGLAKLGSWGALVQVSENLYTRADLLVCTLVLGPVVNASLALVDQLRNQLVNFSTLARGVVLPAASKASASNNKEGMRRLYLRVTRLCLALAAGPAVVLSFFSQEIFIWWVGPGFSKAAAVLPLAMVTLLFSVPVTTSWNIFTAVDRMGPAARAHVFFGLCTQGLSLFLLLKLGWGLEAILLAGLSVAVLRLFFWQLPHLSEVVGSSIKKILFEAMLVPWGGAVGLSLLCLLLKTFHVNGAVFAGGLLVLAVIYLLWIWLGILNSQERGAIVSVLLKQRQETA